MKNKIKQLLKEGLFNRQSQEDDIRIRDFIDFACKFLHINEGRVELTFNRELVTTTAAYGNKRVIVYAKDRAMVDIMRSVAHELVHLKQDIEGRLTDPAKDGMDGSPIEDEANATAGVLIRLYGRANPEIYI